MPAKRVSTGATKSATSAKKLKSDNQDEGSAQDQHFTISNNKRLTVSTFKGKVLIHIRETYEKDGQILPGKKGIALNATDFSKVVSLIDQVKKAVQARGETLEEKSNPDADGTEDLSPEDNLDNDQD